MMWGTLFLTIALCVAGASRVGFKEDIVDFLPSDKENRDINWAFSHIGGDNKVVLTLTPTSDDTDPYELMDAVDSLVNSIHTFVPAEYLKSVMAYADDESVSEVSGFIADNLPYYLSDNDYDQLETMIAEGSLAGRLQAAHSIVTSPVGGIMTGLVTRDPLLLSGTRLKTLENFNRNNSFHTLDGYLFAEDGSALVSVDLAFSSSDTYSAGRFIKAMDKAVSDVESRIDGIAIDALGSVYIAYTNSSQIKRDSILSIVIAVTLIALLLISFFRNVKSILMVAITIMFGFLLSISATSLLLGDMSLIVVGMGAVIIGIAANYPLHFISHIKQGYTARESLNDIVLPLTTGNITTVGAFLSLLFIASPAMHDLGLFAALLLVGTILFTLIFLPHFYNGQSDTGVGQSKFWDWISDFNLGRNRFVFLGIIIVTIILSFFDDNVTFDSNLHNINYMTPRQMKNMDKMLSLAQGDRNITYIAVMGDNMDEALIAYEEILPRIDSLPGRLPGNVTINSLQDFVPSSLSQQERLARWNSFISDYGEKFKELLSDASKECGFATGAFDPFLANISRSYTVQDASYFSPLTDKVAAGHLIADKDRSAVITTIGSTENLTDEISGLLDDPRVVVFDSGSMTEKMIGSLSVEFDTVLYICAFLVFLLLILSFGRLELAGIAFIPLTLGWIWILGLMSVSGINFNIVNIILATFIFGMGDDYTIFITEGVMYEHAYGRKMLRTFEKTILLSALIMFVGIGALILAKHPAMKSLAYVIMIGMFSVVLMADVLPPFIYRFLTLKKGKVRKEPLTLVNFSVTVLAFLVFLTGAIIITVAGFFLITLTFGSKKGKYLYHCLLSAISGFVFKNVFLTGHTIECDETFEKPAIIVSNHQSHLDLMATLMLTPKLIVVTNKWVWNFPLYGPLIRYADFCPIENMLTDDLTKLEEKIAEGYSVLVFPEGTRTSDGTIGRFHKGAFYLAEKYRLDIIPLVLHGLNDVLPKEDLLLRKGHLTVKVLPRIRPDDMSFGSNDRERARNIRQYMASELNRIASKTETVDYFADRVFHNYIYKGADIERSVRRSLKRQDNYRRLAESLPDSGNVLFVNPMMGEPSLICSLAKKNVTIDALMEDEMLFDLASHCVGVPSNLRYLHPGETSSHYDVRVIFDKEGNFSLAYE